MSLIIQEPRATAAKTAAADPKKALSNFVKELESTLKGKKSDIISEATKNQTFDTAQGIIKDAFEKHLAPVVKTPEDREKMCTEASDKGVDTIKKYLPMTAKVAFGLVKKTVKNTLQEVCKRSLKV